MRDEARQRGWAGAFLMALLMVAGASAATGDLRLIEAARNRDRQLVRTLLSQRADVNVRAEDGVTALLWAAHWNDLETAGLLTRAGADVNVANVFGTTPLSEACVNGSAALVDLLLKAGANPNTRIGTGETPLMTCANSGSTDAVRMLVAGGADVNAAEPVGKQTALMWAAAERHPKVVSMLIEVGADVQARSKKGFTALHFAARQGDIETTRVLLAAGVNVDIRAQAAPSEQDSPELARAAAGAGAGGFRTSSAATISGGSTPLLVATVRGEVPLALFLLEQGADPNIADTGFTPLHWAAGSWQNGFANASYGFTDAMSGIPDRQQKLQIIKALLAHGANVNARMTSRPVGFGGYGSPVGATPFFLASAVPDIEVMRLLLAAGADPALMANDNATPLLAATSLNRQTGIYAETEEQAIEAVKLLMELGADPKGVNSFGESALFGPSYRGWNKLIQLLVDHGANVNAMSKAELTPWLAASGLGDRQGGVLFNPETAALLVKLGADTKLGKPCQAQGKCR
jgi:ankyrin repeat protein